MTVKVVGDAPEAVKTAICYHCSAKLEYVPKDVKTYSGTDYSGGSDGQDWIDCPRCDHKVVLRSW